MPELPEVETIVRELRTEIVGKKFWAVKGKFKPVFYPDYDFFKKNLPGLRVLGVERRGKYIILILSNKMRLIVHLRMTGRLLWHKEKGREKYIRAEFNFSDASSLFFSDVRKFGRIWLYNESDYLKKTGLHKLGKEPLDKDFSFEKFYELFKGRKGILKNNLLRQDLIAGIGNIYADEVCFSAGVLPAARLETISKNAYKRIYDAIKYCLKEGIKHCGVTVSDFVGTTGKAGKHQDYLKIYGRKGEKCYRCKNTVKKTRVAGRGTYFCQKCQK